MCFICAGKLLTTSRPSKGCLLGKCTYYFIREYGFFWVEV